MREPIQSPRLRPTKLGVGNTLYVLEKPTRHNDDGSVVKEVEQSMLKPFERDAQLINTVAHVARERSSRQGTYFLQSA